MQSAAPVGRVLLVQGGDKHGRSPLLALALVGVAVLVLLGVLGASAGAVSCTDEFTGSSGGEWSTAGNWSTGLPKASTVVCWSAGKTVVVSSGTQEADSIANGGSLELAGGSLKIASASDASALSGTVLLQSGTLTVEDTTTAAELKITDGTLGGSGTLSLSGAVKWVGEGGGLSGTVKLKQSGGSTFAVEGTGRFYFYGGSVETASPVTISDPEFINNHAAGQFFTTTSTLTLAAIEFNENGGTATVFSARGIRTSGNTVVRNFTLDATGGESRIEGGTLTVPGLATETGSTVKVGSGADLDVTGGTDTLAGTITGKGTFTAGGGTETVESSGVLSTEALTVSGATMTLATGATVEIPTLTTIALGSLTCDTSATTATLKITGGTLAGSGTISASGAVKWVGEGGALSGTVKLKQAGGSTFAVEGTGRFYLYGGTVETGSPVTLGDPEFITANDAQLKTTSTITLGSGLVVPANGGDNATFTAAGIGANTGAEYGFAADALVLTGGTTTVAPGHTLVSGPLTVSGGALRDDGTVKTEFSSTTLTGGTLSGTGTVEGSLTNETGTLAPGDSAPGKLTVEGTYKQEAGGTLAVGIAGTTPDSGFGQLVIKGSATLGGALSLTDEGGFTPASGDKFEVLSATSHSGAFATIAGPSASLYEAESGTGGATVKAKPKPPVNTEAPAISGIPAAGHTLTCSSGVWTNNPNEYEYEWRLDGTPIAGAEFESYIVPSGDAGKTLTCTVFAFVGVLEGEATSAGVTVIGPPANTAPPAISGTLLAGATLSCSPGTWTYNPTEFSYQWNLEGVAIAGATSQTYTVPTTDEGHSLTCAVTATNAAGKGGPTSSGGAAIPAAPANTSLPVVTGTAAAGETLTCTQGAWSGSPNGFTYQWSREGVAIAGATNDTYVIQEADQGHTLTCTVTASNGERGTATSAAVSVAAPPLPLQCTGQSIALVTVRQVGRTVLLSGVALPKYAGQTVTITLSGVSKKLAKGKGGTTVVGPNGAFEAKLAAPSGPGAGLTRYTATVAGNSSLALKLSRALKVAAETSVTGGIRVSFQVTGSLGAGKHVVTVIRELGCKKTVTFATVKLPRSGRFTILLPAPAGAGEISYYRAHTHIAGGSTFSLPVPVAAGS